MWGTVPGGDVEVWGVARQRRPFGRRGGGGVVTAVGGCRRALPLVTAGRAWRPREGHPTPAHTGAVTGCRAVTEARPGVARQRRPHSRRGEHPRGKEPAADPSCRAQRRRPQPGVGYRRRRLPEGQATRANHPTHPSRTHPQRPARRRLPEGHPPHPDHRHTRQATAAGGAAATPTHAPPAAGCRSAHPDPGTHQTRQPASTRPATATRWRAAGSQAPAGEPGTRPTGGRHPEVGRRKQPKATTPGTARQQERKAPPGRYAPRGLSAAGRRPAGG